MTTNDFMSAEGLIRQDKLDREAEEVLRLVKVYVENRIRALEYHAKYGYAHECAAKQVRIDLVFQMSRIAKSLRPGHPLFTKMDSFAGNLAQIWFLPDATNVVRQMHRVLDPYCDKRSIVPRYEQPIRGHGSLH